MAKEQIVITNYSSLDNERIIKVSKTDFPRSITTLDSTSAEKLTYCPGKYRVIIENSFNWTKSRDTSVEFIVTFASNRLRSKKTKLNESVQAVNGVYANTAFR